MGHSWISIAGWAVIAFTCVFAWMRGAAAERWGSLWVLVMDLASDAAIAFTYPRPPEMILFSLDFLLATGLLVLAVRYSSLWLGIAMLLQAVALCAHAFRLVGEGLETVSWIVLNNVLSELMLVCIMIATAISWRRRRKPPAPPRPAFEYIGDASAH